MAETALGVVGLVGLFGTCIQCIDLFEVGKAQSGSLDILSTKLDNQKVLFLVWGESVGLTTEEGSGRPIDRMSDTIRERVASTITQIYKLFQETEKLKLQYSLEVDQSPTESSETTTLQQIYEVRDQ